MADRGLSSFDIVKTDDLYSIVYDSESKVEIRDVLDDDSLLRRPEFSLKKWDEFWLRILPSGKTSVAITEDKAGQVINKLVVDDPSKDYSLEGYPLDTTDSRDIGGLEIEFILEVKPASNKVNFDLEYSKGLRFCYQPPMTEETWLLDRYGDTVDTVSATEMWIKADGETPAYRAAQRPENIVGSYAVYCDKKNNKYKAGKFCHIERPKAIDADGVEEWCELSITVDDSIGHGSLVVTVPQAFLDTAKYPVRVDPTFGYTTAGGASASNWDLIGGYIDNPGESGTVTKITAYTGAVTITDNRKAALYTSDGNTLISPQSAENSGSKSVGWEDFTVSNADVTAQDYAICVWMDWVTPTLYYDSGQPSGTSKSASQSYGAWPASVSFSNETVAVSVYATYTSATINVTNIDTDDNVFNGQLSVNVNGTVFEASQGTGKVEFGDAATYGACTKIILQPISSWSDTQITLTKIRKGNLSNGTVYAYVTNDSDEQSPGHAFTIRENWGRLTVGGSASSVNYTRLMGGSPPNADNMILRSASIRVGATHSNQVRIAVYQGGALATGPDAATLLKDFGLTTGSATNTWLTLTHVGNDIDVNKTDPVWIAWKGNDSGFDIQYSASSADAGDFQTARGRYNSVAVSSDESTSYPSTWPSDTGAFADFWYSIYLTYEIKGTIYQYTT
jgi:hypothetical protein